MCLAAGYNSGSRHPSGYGPSGNLGFRVSVHYEGTRNLVG